MNLSIAMVETGGWGGLGHYTHCLCETLAQAGVRVRLLTHARNYALDSFPKHYEVEPLFVGDGMGADWDRLRRSLTTHGDDIVHFQSILAPRRDWAMVRWLQLRGGFPKAVLTAHNILPHEVRCGDRFAYRQLYRASDGIIVHSQASRDRLAGVMGDRFIEKRPVAVIPHGHYGMLTERPGLTREWAMERLGLPDAHYITCFGAVRPYKGVDWLLEAVAGIVDWPSDLKVLVIGKILIGVTEEEITGLARRLGVEDRVVMRFEYVAEEEIPHVFAASDLMLLPYRAIDQSGVLLASLAAGKPVLVTPVGAFSEMVHGSIGFMASEVSALGVESALRQALAQREMWPSMGRAAHEVAYSEFGWERSARLSQEFYCRVVQGET